MQLALYRFLDEELELLRGKRLDNDYFNTLLTGGDPVRDLLQWLDQESSYRDACPVNESSFQAPGNRGLRLFSGYKRILF